MAAKVIDLLLAHSITTAVTGGSCVAATGLGDTHATMALAAQELTEARMRVLQLWPPFDERPFAEQFATAWCASSLPGGKPALAASTAVAALPTAASEPFAVLVHDAHLLPHATLRHLDRMARTWDPCAWRSPAGPSSCMSSRRTTYRRSGARSRRSSASRHRARSRPRWAHPHRAGRAWPSWPRRRRTAPPSGPAGRWPRGPLLRPRRRRRCVRRGMAP